VKGPSTGRSSQKAAPSGQALSWIVGGERLERLERLALRLVETGGPPAPLLNARVSGGLLVQLRTSTLSLPLGSWEALLLTAGLVGKKRTELLFLADHHDRVVLPTANSEQPLQACASGASRRGISKVDRQQRGK
jgi:hypothetical protein